MGAAQKTIVTIAPGTRWATLCYVQDAGIPGPTVVITAGLHGDEPAGAWAASEIRTWPIRRGKLVVLPRANAPGLAMQWHSMPGVDKALHNLDRRFSDPGQAHPGDDSPADAIWQAVAAAKPDWLVDLHEGGSFRKIEPRSTGNTLATVGKEASAAAARMLAAINATIDDGSKAFSPRKRPVVGTLARAAADRLNANALVVETTRCEDQPLALRIRQHRIAVHALLEHLGMIDSRASVDAIVDLDGAARPIRVAVYAGPGTRRGMHHLIQELQQLPGTMLLPVGPEEINAGVLTHFNVVLFPGGSSTRQGETLGSLNREQVRDFIERGGGYVGICAGAYLATAEFPWALKIVDARPHSSQRKRGRGMVEMEFTPAGRAILGADARGYSVRYHNGPILVPAQREEIPNFQALAVFRSEVAEGEAVRGVMVGSPLNWK